MTKKMFAFFAALTLLCGLFTGASASVDYMQEINTYCNGAVEYSYSLDKDSYRQGIFEAKDGDSQYYAMEYADYLADTAQFDYLGTYYSGSWVHLCLVAGRNHYYDSFRLKSNGAAVTDYSVVIVSYAPGEKTIYVRYSKDLLPIDQGARMRYNAGGSSASPSDSLVQDPVAYSCGSLRQTGGADKNGYHQQYYEIKSGDAGAFCRDYCDVLSYQGNLEFLETRYANDWVHLCLRSARGYSFDTFHLTSYGTELTPYSVVVVSYKPNSKTIYVRHSDSVVLGDKGYRHN